LNPLIPPFWTQQYEWEGLDREAYQEDNAGSRATIEKNGGIYEDTRKGKRRYWIDTA